MVQASIWKEAKLIASDACCCSCLEKRLQRSLGPVDFDWRFPINLLLPFSFENDEALLILLRSLSMNLGKPENALDETLYDVKTARGVFPNGTTMKQSTGWFRDHLFPGPA